MSKALYTPCPLCCIPCLYALDRKKSLLVTFSGVNTRGCVNDNNGGPVHPYQSNICDGFFGGGFIVPPFEPALNSPFFRFRATNAISCRGYGPSADIDIGHGCSSDPTSSDVSDLVIDIACSFEGYWSVDVGPPPETTGVYWFSGSAKWGEVADNIFLEPPDPAPPGTPWGWGGTATVEIIP